MADFERRTFSLSELQTTQADQARRLSEMVYQPEEVTRADYYLLPSLQEGLALFNPATTYNLALARLLQTGQPVRILDLGCGAGSWIEHQNRIDLVDAYGISARDYRRRESRPPLIPTSQDDRHKGPTYTSPDGNSLYYGEEIVRTIQIDDNHYLVGDMHDLLRRLPENYFHLIVSYQACRYLLDPLRVLKQVHRLLATDGCAFLESFQPVILTNAGSPVPPSKIQRYLRRQGHLLEYGGYSPDEYHDKFGLALKKTQPKLTLPVTYRGISKTSATSTYQTETVTYCWRN